MVVEFIFATAYTIVNGKDRVYFGPVARNLNRFQVLSFAPPSVQPLAAEGRTVNDNRQSTMP